MRCEANPVGKGSAPEAGRGVHVAAPRLFYPQQDWRGPKDQPRPAGFGPVGRHWRDRAALAGTFDTAWMQTRAPLLPRDHDPEFRQATPRDQRFAGHLRGGEPVALRGVRWGSAGTVPAPAFALPHVQFEVETFFRGAWRPQPMQIDSVVIDAPARQVRLCWCGALAIGAAAHDIALRETRISLRSARGFAVPAGRVDQFYSAGEAV